MECVNLYFLILEKEYLLWCVEKYNTLKLGETVETKEGEYHIDYVSQRARIVLVRKMVRLCGAGRGY